MALVLLKCSICPRQPDFSDTSHLLTHISSKGHLAHLHKLQVRSHQEIAAGQQLVAYNLWYQQHGLGQLLSERLQQKDAKKASSSRDKRTKLTSKRPRRSVATTDMRNAPVASEPLGRAGLRMRTNTALGLQGQPLSYPEWDEQSTSHLYPSDDEDNFASSPTPKLRCLPHVALLDPPLKRPASGMTNPVDLDEDEEESEASRLKGLVWPGMDIFDAATDEMRRKRNQKKDGSLLKLMERCSKRIEATEIIYSPSGVMRKQRPITGNVEDTSPLKGETPIPKKRASRSKRAVLAETTGNIPATRRRSTRAVTGQRGTGRNNGLATVGAPKQSTSTLYNPGDRYLPTEDDRRELDLTLGYGPSNARKKGLTVFRDERHNDITSLNTSTAPTSASGYSGFGNAGTYFGDEAINRDDYTGDQMDSFPWRRMETRTLQPLASGKENIDPSDFHTSGTHTNPLGWADSCSDSRLLHQDLDREQNQYIPGPIMHSLPTDSFGYSSNPLSFAFQRLRNRPDDPFTDFHYGFEEMPDKDGLGAMDSALSENEGTDLPKGFFGDERR